MGELDEHRPFVYARSAGAGSQRFPALFLGDPHPTFQDIRRTMRAGLNLSLLGFARWTADVFGLDGKTTPETHARYAQWALLNPMARYLIRPEQFDDARFPWSHGPEVEANFRSYAELRYRLLPYYYTTTRWPGRHTAPAYRHCARCGSSSRNRASMPLRIRSCLARRCSSHPSLPLAPGGEPSNCPVPFGTTSGRRKATRGAAWCTTPLPWIGYHSWCLVAASSPSSQ